MIGPRTSSRWQIAAAAAALVALGAGLGGCLRSTTFACTSDVDCTGSAPGRCEPVGFCSFADGSCAAGRRFGDHAGSYSDRCVGELGSDGGIDAPGDGMIDARIDAMIDAPPAGCPATYAALPGVAAHVYRAIPAAGIWTTQRTACTADGGYLVEPDDAAELAAVNMLAGAVEIWVGLSDLATEGTFVTGRGAAPAYVLWEAGEPDNLPQQGGGGDCVRSSATGTYADDRCSTPRRAVCECEP